MTDNEPFAKRSGAASVHGMRRIGSLHQHWVKLGNIYFTVSYFHTTKRKYMGILLA